LAFDILRNFFAAAFCPINLRLGCKKKNENILKFDKGSGTVSTKWRFYGVTLKVASLLVFTKIIITLECIDPEL